ncbi:DUF555 domain-containing protein [Halobacteria archaeon AArc-curdl1]|uniref:UPF0212 protein OB919_15105 n=1 Tax=Natronosalvus hydrolyticus TaxID=2979988 RepID=A0AAP2ZCG3_9EURY|nr:DUF555 domain-containing protein [Halobacteria archaeon AArc-curdl1]
MHCRVVVEAAVPVYDVETEDEAIRIAISKTGEMLNPDLNYVEINMGERTSPGGEELAPAFIAADEALVALELEMTVFNVEREEHASRIARKEIGQRLQNIPLEVLSVEIIEDDDEDDAEAEDDEDDAEAEDDEDDAEAEDDEDDQSADDDASSDEAADSESETTDEDDDDDVLPEFEDLLE